MGRYVVLKLTRKEADALLTCMQASDAHPMNGSEDDANYRPLIQPILRVESKIYGAIREANHEPPQA